MNFEQLADETLMLCEEMGRGSLVEKEPDFIEDSTGIFFRVDLGTNTFCIRAVAALSLDDIIDKIKEGDRAILKELKVDSADLLDSLQYFETESLSESEKVIGAVANRRFPYKEELLCNLSDPGPYWWMDLGESDCSVYFTTNRIEREEGLINLGPIGDPALIASKFRASSNLINELFPLEELSFSDKFISLHSSKNSESSLYTSFIEIFKNGTFSNSLRDAILELGGYELCEYLHSLAIIRKFWIEINETHLTSD